MSPTSALRLRWAVEVAAIIGATILVIGGSATIHAGASPSLAVVGGLAVVATAAVVAAATPLGPGRTAPIMLALFVPGLLRADSAGLAVLGFGAAALLPIAAAYAADPRPRVSTLIAFAACIAAAAARVLLRDPFRELHCAPACVTNPYLVTRAPDVVRASEILAGLVALAWGALMVGRAVARRPGVDTKVTALDAASVGAVTAVWSVHMVLRPRFLPDNAVDRWLFIGSVGAVIVVAMARSVLPIEVGITGLRIRRFGRSLSSSRDLTSITHGIRAAAGDNSLTVVLGEAADVSGAPTETTMTTSVVRAGRIVATIRHLPESRPRIAAAVTPAVALALETQLVMQQAESQLAGLQRSRAAAAMAADEARRRLERDLHDGAQQHLLLVGMGLANASSDPRAPRDAKWQAAAAKVGEALGELRRIGRGGAAIIAELGLEDAVTSLAGTADIALTVTFERCTTADHECWPLAPSTTAYRLLVGSVVEAHRSHATALHTELCCLGPERGRTIMTTHDGRSLGDRASDRDRVLAAGGRITTEPTPTAVTLAVWLP